MKSTEETIHFDITKISEMQLAETEIANCVVPKIPRPIPGRVSGNSKGEGGGVSKANKEHMKLNWNFQRGGHTNIKPSFVRGSSLHIMDNFWNNTLEDGRVLVAPSEY